MTANETFGARLKRLREARGLSQLQLADLVWPEDVGRNIEADIDGYEALGDRDQVYPALLVRFATALGCSTDKLLGMPEHPSLARLREALDAAPDKLYQDEDGLCGIKEVDAVLGDLRKLLPP
jgi:transcriptional regulator with XRE-family HTH domain